MAFLLTCTCKENQYMKICLRCATLETCISDTFCKTTTILRSQTNLIDKCAQQRLFDFLFEVLRPSQPNGVMPSAVSLPNHTFTGQA